MTNITNPSTSAKTAMATAIRDNASDLHQFNLYNINGHVAFIKATLSHRKENDTRVRFSVFRMWGDTYPIRSFLNEQGWVWNKDEKCWYLEADTTMQTTDFEYIEYIDPLTSTGYNLYIAVVMAEPMPEFFHQEKVLYPLFWAMLANQIEMRWYNGRVPELGGEGSHMIYLRTAHLEMKRLDVSAEYKAAYAWAKSFVDKPLPESA